MTELKGFLYKYWLALAILGFFMVFHVTLGLYSWLLIDIVFGATLIGFLVWWGHRTSRNRQQ